MAGKSISAKKGGVLWITGLSGSGKTTVAALLRERLLSRGLEPIWIDGNRLRELLPWKLGFSEADRRNLALFYAQLSQELAEQGQLVICSTISLFTEIHVRNRTNIRNYFEVLLRVSIHELKRRDIRNIYSNPMASDVVGVSCAAEFPTSPDLIVDNESPVFPETACDQIMQALIHEHWIKNPENA